MNVDRRRGREITGNNASGCVSCEWTVILIPPRRCHRRTRALRAMKTKRVFQITPDGSFFFSSVIVLRLSVMIMIVTITNPRSLSGQSWGANLRYRAWLYMQYVIYYLDQCMCGKYLDQCMHVWVDTILISYLAALARAAAETNPAQVTSNGNNIAGEIGREARVKREGGDILTRGIWGG